MVTNTDIQKYEGLVFKTATLYEGRVEDMDLDDLRQTFRIKVWQALEAYDPRRSNLPEGRYVFGCIVNQGKDLLRRKRRGVLFIEDVAPSAPAGNSTGDVATNGTRERFEAKYLSLEADEIFELIENDDAVVPNTLGPIERRVVCLIYASYNKGEIADALELTRRELNLAFEGIEAKMADWRPTT